jgi:hypothetical protein
MALTHTHRLTEVSDPHLSVFIWMQKRDLASNQLQGNEDTIALANEEPKREGLPAQLDPGAQGKYHWGSVLTLLPSGWALFFGGLWFEIEMSPTDLCVES